MDKHFYKECKITDINKEDRTLVVIASDETIDRYNEIMIAKGCKYGDYLPFLWAHNRAEILPPIGRIQSVNKRNNRVKVKVDFAKTEFADSILKLYTSEPPMMEKVSVGFITKKDRKPTKDEEKKGVKKVIEEWELLEVSAVPIPANPNAGIEKEMRIRIKEAVDAGELQLPEMVYKDFGFEEKEISTNAETISESEISENESEEEKLKKDVEEYNKATGLNRTPEDMIKMRTSSGATYEDHFGEEEKIEEKPMENFHVCDISTKKYPKYRVVKCERKHEGKCIDVNYGILAPKKSEVSSLRYDIKIWKEASARSHCKGEKGKFFPATKEAKVEKYKCECIKCGHKLESEKHCKDIKCPECGGEMRRVGRPGPGREIEVDVSNTLENYKLVYNEETNQYYFILKEQAEKDHLRIVEPTIKFKDDPQKQDVKLENVAKDEGIDYDKFVKEVVKELIDSLRGTFRRDFLGIVDDD